MLHEKKDQKILSKLILLVIIIALALGLIYLLAPNSMNITVCTLTNDKNINKAFEPALQEEISNIPEENLYYMYFDEKIMLKRERNECGFYFTSERNNDLKIWITRELIIAFKSDEEAKSLNEILSSENLELKSSLSGDNNSYVVATTEDSKYQDSLQMSQYIYQNYADLLKYPASPNWIQTGGLL